MVEPKITEADLTDLLPDSNNANRGTQRGQKLIQDSLREDGMGRGIVVDANNNVVAGNKTLENAVDIGIDKAIIVETTGEELVVTKRMDWDLYEDESPRRYAWRDNQAALKSINYDPEILLTEIERGVDFEGIFEQDEIEEILGELGGGEPPESPEPPIDKAKELQEKWGVNEGDIWQIESKVNPGQYHRLICGDCRERGVVEAVTEGRKVNGVFTSPPYAMQRAKQYGGVEVEDYVEWWESVQENMRAAMVDDGSFFVNIKPHCEDGQRVLYVFDLVLAMVREWGWRFVDELCWYRGGYPGRWANRFKNEFEPVYHFSLSSVIALNHQNVIQEFAPSSLSDKLTVYNGLDNAPASGGSPFKQKWKKSAEFDGALPGNVLKIPHSETAKNTGAFQAAPFPPKLPTFFIKAYSDPLDTWLDPFCGSGTTAIAAENEGRLGLMIEQLPKYCAVTLQRFLDLTNIQPELIK
jgi:DNA modification methylase